MEKINKNYVILTLKVVLILIVLIICLWKINFNIIISNINYNLLLSMILVQPIVIINFILVSIRYKILLNKEFIKFNSVFKSIIFSLGATSILPARTSEILKPLYLKNIYNLEISHSLAAVFLERLGDVIILGFMILFSLMMLVFNINYYIFVSIIIFAFFGLVSFPYLEKFYMKIVSFLPFTMIKNFSENFIQSISINIKNGNFYKAHFFSLIIWSFNYFLVLVFFHVNCPSNLNFRIAFLTLVASSIGITLQVLPAGIGTYEASIIYVLLKYGYGFEQSLTLAISLHIASFIFCTIGAVIIFLTEKVEFSNYKNLYKEKG